MRIGKHKLGLVITWLALAAVLTMAGSLAVIAAPSSPDPLEVSQPTHLTSNSEYDRNPSIVHDGTDYWLFHTKGDDTSTSGVRGGGYDPDADTYVVYYKKASTIAGVAGASETKLALSDTSRPAGFDQRVVSATYFNSKVYAFVSSGQSGTDRGLYYYAWDGSSWSGPTTLIADSTARGGHVNVTSDSSYVYIVWESSDGSSDCYTWDGTTLSSKVDISADNQPKITVMGTTLYVVSVEDTSGDIEVHSASAGSSPSFSSHSTAISGAGLYDPCIFNDGTDLYVVTAPYDSGNDRQYLKQAKYSGGSWSTAKMVSYGGYGGTYWWEYWPIGYYDGSDLYVFFTTETSSPSYSDGEIAYFKMDWNLANDHYFYIQNAIEAANDGDTINVAAGTYPEAMNIAGFSGLTLNGADKTTVTVKPTSVLPHNACGYTTDRNSAIRVVDSTDVTLQNMTMDFDLVKADLVHGIFFCDSTGTVQSNVLKNLSLPDEASGGGHLEIGSDFRGPGFTHASPAEITISDNTFIDTGRIGIVTHDHVDATIAGNTFYKTTDDFGYAIEIGGPSMGTISGNTMYGFDTPALSDGSESAGIYIESAWTSGITSPLTKNVLVENNEIYDSQYGMWIGNGYDGFAGDVDIVVTLNGNNLHDNTDGAAWIQDEDKEYGSSVTVTGGGNSLTDNGDYGYYWSPGSRGASRRAP